MQQVFEYVALAFELIGVAVIALGFVVAVVLAARSLARDHDGRAAFTTLRDSFGLVILLGLEILIAADLVRTVTSAPTLTDALVLALIVLIRTVLSFSLQVEIEGVAPWKRALLPAPAQIADRVREGGTRAGLQDQRLQDQRPQDQRPQDQRPPDQRAPDQRPPDQRAPDQTE